MLASVIERFDDDQLAIIGDFLDALVAGAVPETGA
jgi:hypothetical protein